MSASDSNPTGSLANLLDQAAQDLASQEPAAGESEPEGLLFLGTWHDSYPTILVRDPLLTDSAKLQLLFLMQESRQKPHGGIAMPAVNKTAEELGYSRMTVIRDRMLLRVCRWVSRYRRVRDARGRFRGSIYAIHSEPCTLADTSRLDHEYMACLDQCIAHSDPYIQRAARAALDGIDGAVAQGKDPLAAEDAVDRRIEAINTLRTGAGGFFGFVFEQQAAIQHPAGDGQLNGASPDQHPDAQLRPGPNFGPGSDRGPNSGPGQNRGQNFGPGGESPGQKFGPGAQVPENPQSTNFGPGHISSSSSSTTTTTGENDPTARGCAREAGDQAPQAQLRWPEEFDTNKRALVSRVLYRRRVPEAAQQDIVDVLAAKARDVNNPLRSPVSYADTLCQRFHAGEFQPIGGLSTDSPNQRCGDDAGNGSARPNRELAVEIRNLRAEIDSLEGQLIPAATGAARSSLESQAAELHRRLQHREAQHQRLQQATTEPGSDYAPE